MPDNIDELLQSPYDREPTTRRWMAFAGIAVFAMVVVGVIWILNAGRADQGDAAGVPTTSVSVPGPPSENASDSTTTTVVAQEPGISPEPVFDPATSGYGYEEIFEPADEGATYRALQAWTNPEQVGGDEDEGETIVVGYSPSLHRGVLQSDTVSVPDQGGSAEELRRCVGFTDFGGTSSSCWTVDKEVLGRPVLAGQELFLDIVAWVDLPESASVGVLTVNSEFLAWQRPRYGIVVFQYEAEVGDIIELTVLDATGNTVGVIDRTQPATGEPELVPITGYGDFSDTALDSVDWYDVQERIVHCLNDQGIDATLPARSKTSPDHVPGISFGGDQNVAGEEVHEIMSRCRAGLSLPDQLPADPNDLYDYFEEIHLCLADLGYDSGPMPAFEEWMEQPMGTRWDPTIVLFRRYEEIQGGHQGESTDSPTTACVVVPGSS